MASPGHNELNKLCDNTHLVVMHCYPIAGSWRIAQENGGFKGANSSSSKI